MEKLTEKRFAALTVRLWRLLKRLEPLSAELIKRGMKHSRGTMLRPANTNSEERLLSRYHKVRHNADIVVGEFRGVIYG